MYLKCTCDKWSEVMDSNRAGNLYIRFHTIYNHHHAGCDPSDPLFWHNGRIEDQDTFVYCPWCRKELVESEV